MSLAPQKFAFDLDLGHRQERNALVTETAMRDMLQKARDEGFAEGLKSGEQNAAAKASLALAQAAEKLAGETANMAASLDDARRQMLGEAVELAAAIGRKLAAALIASEPVAEIEALVAECLATLEGVPHLVIRCTPSLADAVRDLALQRIEASGFAGRLVVLGDPDIAAGDARIEWADGGVVRDRAALEAEIDSRIAAFLAARGVTPTESDR